MKPRPPRTRRVCAKCKEHNCTWCILNDPQQQGWRKDTNPLTGATRTLCLKCYEAMGWETAAERGESPDEPQNAGEAEPGKSIPAITDYLRIPELTKELPPPPPPHDPDAIPEPPPFPSRRDAPSILRPNLRSFYVAWHLFVQWCQDNRQRPFPAHPQTVTHYLALLDYRGATLSTVQHHRIAIILMHDHHRITPNPAQEPGFQKIP